MREAKELVVMIVFLSMIGSLVFFSVAFFLLRKIFSNRKSIQDLFRYLFWVAEQEGVKIYTSYMLCVGKYDYEKKEIYIHPFYKRNPMILAHELGHHLAIRNGQFSEEAAEREARRLVREAWGRKTRWLLPFWQIAAKIFLVEWSDYAY